MNRLIALVFLALWAVPAGAASLSEDDAQKGDGMVPKQAVEINLNDFLWQKRPIIVFADTDADPRFREQLQLLADRPVALEDRDVVIIVDTDPDAKSALREKLRPRGFMLVLLGKDGGVKLRKPFPWDVRELSRAIDKTPLRQQELRDGRRSE